MINIYFTKSTPEIYSIIATLVAAGSTCYLAISQSKLGRAQAELQEKQLKSEQANLEFNTRNQIHLVSSELHKCFMSLVDDLDKKTKSQQSARLKIRVFKSVQEEYRNAYEDACEKYINGKIDKDSFKNLYFGEIRRLVENENQHKYYISNPPRYKYTVQVYRELSNDPENLCRRSQNDPELDNLTASAKFKKLLKRVGSARSRNSIYASCVVRKVFKKNISAQLKP